MTLSTVRSVSNSIPHSPTLLIVALGTSIRLIHIIFLYVLSRILPPFDSSHTLLSARNLPGLRWDAVHFVSIAEHGYTHEQQLAFQPLFMALLRITGECSAWVRGGGGEVDVGDIVWGGMGVSAVVWVGASIMLYKLTNHLYNPKFALLTTLLYLLPPSPVPSLPYTEPLYALTTFSGMYFLVVRRQYMLCGVLFACSTGMRATGIFNVLVLSGVGVLEGVTVKSMTAQGLIRRIITRSYRLIIPCLLPISPFLLFQWYAYHSFCVEKTEDRRPWCESRLPFAYGFVQKEYW
nr:hypothetical protein I302_02951 [Kwoniella bestiolae CBS 10118]OCF28100.1 hypothetical protein I302_02951 [Kwoniella bestiolae CBS 10118]